jgi:nicotinate-nucleotide adenylyltransferase
VDTLKSLGFRPVLLLGGDQYAKLETWHRWREVLELADIAVFARPGFAPGDGRARLVPFAPLAISASQIRARLARGEDVSAMVPPKVLAYVREHGLYR